MHMGVSLALSQVRGAAGSVPPAPWSPVYASTAGGGYLILDAAASGWPFADSDKFTAAMLLDDFSNLPSVAAWLWEINGRANASVGSTWRPTVTFETSVNGTFLTNWSGSAGVDIRTGRTGQQLVHVVADFGVSPSMIMTVGSTIAGTFTTGPITGTIDLTRDDSATDYSVFAQPSGLNKLNCKCAYVYMESGVARPVSDFMDGAAFRDPATFGAPQVLFKGAGLTTGTNIGSAGGTWPVTGGTINLV